MPKKEPFCRISAPTILIPATIPTPPKNGGNDSLEKADMGILICGTGIGISIAANRYHGIRAALLYDDFVAEMAKKHNNANVIVFGGRTMKTQDVIRRIDIFNQNEFEGGRHIRRIEKIEEGK